MIKVLALFSFLFFTFPPVNGVEDEIRIGQYLYKTKKTKVFLKDEGYNSVFYSLYTLNGVHQAGVLLEVKRNDSVFISGNYSIEANKFITRNYYHIKQWYDPDSSMKVFVQNAKGRLELTSFVEYNDGKVLNKLR